MSPESSESVAHPDAIVVRGPAALVVEVVRKLCLEQALTKLGDDAENGR